MRKVQAIRLNMFNTVVSLCETRPDIFASMPALAESYAAFKANLADINATIQLRIQVLSGYTADKLKLRTHLIEEAAHIAASVATYARSVSDNLLHDSVNYTIRQLERLKDDELSPVCKNISEAGTNVLDHLAKYNITQISMDAFNVSIAEFEAWWPLARKAIAVRRTYITTLTEKLKRGDDILRLQIDRQLRQLKRKHPEFYQSYSNTREIINIGGTATQIKGVVTDSDTNEPLTDVTITVLEKDIQVTVTNEGKFVIKPLTGDTYTVEAGKEGYESKTITGIDVKQGKITTVEISLTPNS